MVLPKLQSDTRILIIRINHSNAGLFAYLTFVLNQIIYCEENDMVPVVYFGPWSVDGPNAYHEPEKGDNMWSYYFEPVAGYSFEDIQQLIADPKEPITEENLVYLDDDVLGYIHGGKPNSIYCFPYGYFTDLEENIDEWYDGQRRKAQELIKKYVRVKNALIEESDAFVDQYFGEHTVLGVHIRGTDKVRQAKRIEKIITPGKYFPHIDSFLRQHPDAKIFLATDQDQYVEQMMEKYPGRVLTQSTIYSRSRVNTFQKQDGNNYQKGKEALLDCLLLSRCQRLLKCSSALSEFAFYFNPQLTGLDLNEHYSQRTFIQKQRRIFLADPNTFLRGFIQTIKDPEKGKAAVFWYLLTDYPLIRRFSNRLEAAQFSRNAVMRYLFFAKKYISLVRNKEQIPLQQIIQFAGHSARRLGSDYYAFRTAMGKKYLEIRTDSDPQAAFFAQFAYVLQQLRFAETNNLIPIVNLDHPYNFYHDQNYGANVWENYFDSVAEISSTELDKLDPRTITFLRPEEQRNLYLGDGDMPPLEYDTETKRWWQKQRTMGGRLTSKYVRVKPEITKRVDQFYEAHFEGQTVLGMHLRGTDKSVGPDGKRYDWPELFIRIVPPEEYFPLIDQFIVQNPEGKLFVATDQKQFLDTIIEAYGDRVIQTSAVRSDTEKAVFSRSGRGYERGLEVLIDALLLSKCDYLIKCMSNVGEAAVYFNPEIPIIDVFYPQNVDEFRTFFSKPTAVNS